MNAKQLPIAKTTTSSLHCKVPRCAQLHPRHYCDRCLDENSDHLNVDCPSPLRQEDPRPKTRRISQQKPSALRCKVPRCGHLHNRHYCEECFNEDSDHLSTDCPRPAFVPSPRVPYQGASALHCKVPRCAQLHSRHYCHTCQDEDSNHLSTDCPRPTYQPISRIPLQGSSSLHCRVHRCGQLHSRHYCENCQDGNSDHLSIHCLNSPR